MFKITNRSWRKERKQNRTGKTERTGYLKGLVNKMMWVCMHELLLSFWLTLKKNPVFIYLSSSSLLTSLYSSKMMADFIIITTTLIVQHRKKARCGEGRAGTRCGTEASSQLVGWGGAREPLDVEVILKDSAAWLKSPSCLFGIVREIAGKGEILFPDDFVLPQNLLEQATVLRPATGSSRHIQITVKAS